MTPIAHRIIKDSLRPKGTRKYSGKGPERLGLFDKDLHFFECSAVRQEAYSLGRDLAMRRPSGAEQLAFLPSKRTWIEAITGEHEGRRAYLLDTIDATSATMRFVYTSPDDSLHYSDTLLNLPLFGGPELPNNYGNYDILTTLKDPTDSQVFFQTAWTIYAYLAMINTPRIFSREEHTPHRGLERQLKAASNSRAFELQNWTEIKLSVLPPKAHESDPEESLLTGKRAQHFVRSHLRIRLGKLELVSPHWRGDPALGIVQSRYVVKDGQGIVGYAG